MTRELIKQDTFIDAGNIGPADYFSMIERDQSIRGGSYGGDLLVDHCAGSPLRMFFPVSVVRKLIAEDFDDSGTDQRQA
ncbi:MULTISPECIES: hypothetical protein [Alphaproteobacteria]|uniref:Uncharacterized protein n=1 Tax=Actibacterium naphthalenivorans TaxID=1614693 RepID=A0A840CE38_9RHOB|nr:MULTISPECIES: hypothetical protein [Actibacterium]ALG92277.1 hypothetical protein TQ29_18840 [Actibacterium sp. EMB200-NS6]MBB4023605.1 hypothetical protein [Actibacterium naphthalenivorans]